MGQDCVPHGGEAHTESFARRPRGGGGSDLTLDLGPAARPHWRMSHPAGTPCCPAASTSSARSWLSGSLMRPIHFVLMSFPKHEHQVHERRLGRESGDLGSNPDGAVIQGSVRLALSGPQFPHLNTGASLFMLPSASLWLGRLGSLRSSPRQAAGAEGNRLWGLRGTLLGGDVHLHVFPGARSCRLADGELLGRYRGTTGQRTGWIWQLGGTASKAWLVLKGFSCACYGGVFLRAGCSLKWQGCAPFWDEGGCTREATNSTQ